MIICQSKYEVAYTFDYVNEVFDDLPSVALR